MLLLFRSMIGSMTRSMFLERGVDVIAQRDRHRARRCDDSRGPHGRAARTRACRRSRRARRRRPGRRVWRRGSTSAPRRSATNAPTRTSAPVLASRADVGYSTSPSTFVARLRRVTTFWSNVALHQWAKPPPSGGGGSGASELREEIDVALQVGDQEVGEVAREAVAHDDAQRREVLAVLRERVRRHEPAPLAQALRDVEHGVRRGPRPSSANANTGSSLPSVMQLERPDRRRSRRRCSARRRATSAARGGSRRSRGARSCSTARRPGCPAARSSARTSACCRRGS